MQIPSSEHHPCSVRGLHFNDIENMDPQTLKMARNKDMHNIVKQCQTHSHSATCYKYWKGPPDPKECRFDLDEKIPVQKAMLILKVVNFTCNA